MHAQIPKGLFGARRPADSNLMTPEQKEALQGEFDGIRDGIRADTMKQRTFHPPAWMSEVQDEVNPAMDSQVIFIPLLPPLCCFAWRIRNAIDRGA